MLKPNPAIFIWAMSLWLYNFFFFAALLNAGNDEDFTVGGGGDQANPVLPEPSAEDDRFWSETVKFRTDGCGCSYLYGNNVKHIL